MITYSISEVQSRVLETVKPVLDRLKERISAQFEEGWNKYQKALSTYEESEYYRTNIERINKDYEDIKRLYSKIVSGEYKSNGKNAVLEAEKALEKNEESLPKKLACIKDYAIKYAYWTSLGYKVNLQAYKKSDPDVQKNAEIAKSPLFSLYLSCSSRESFENKRDSEINYLIEMNIMKLKNQISKKLAPIEKEIVSFENFDFYPTEDGYVGSWRVRTLDKNYIFTTKCILAGGYNIQILHIRYLGHLKLIK